jgi:hypothetical protein
MNKTTIGIAVLIYNFMVVAGTAWLVAVHDWSSWWFMLSLAIMMNIRNKDE